MCGLRAFTFTPRWLVVAAVGWTDREVVSSVFRWLSTYFSLSQTGGGNGGWGSGGGGCPSLWICQ